MTPALRIEWGGKVFEFASREDAKRAGFEVPAEEVRSQKSGDRSAILTSPTSSTSDSPQGGPS